MGSQNEVVDRRRRSKASLHVECDTATKKLRMMESYSPTKLARKLDGVTATLLKENNAALVELKNFEGGFDGTLEEYEQRREEIRSHVADPAHFDSSGRTALNIEGAAIAGAKLLIDETRATRSMSKQLRDKCGIEEEDILYKPLGYGGDETTSAMETYCRRQASVLESFVDYKKQIQFKTKILSAVDASDNRSKSDMRFTRKQQQQMALERRRVEETKKVRGKQKGLSQEGMMRTPKMQREFNPLDENRIIDEYALEVASEVRENSLRKKRPIAPIPINFDILDSDDEEMDIN